MLLYLLEDLDSRSNSTLILELLQEANLANNYDNRTAMHVRLLYHGVLKYLFELTQLHSIFTIQKGELIPVTREPPPIHLNLNQSVRWTDLIYEVNRWGLIDSSTNLNLPLETWIFNPAPFLTEDPLHKARFEDPNNFIKVGSEIWLRHPVSPDRYLLYPFSLIWALTEHDSNLVCSYRLKSPLLSSLLKQQV